MTNMKLVEKIGNSTGFNLRYKQKIKVEDGEKAFFSNERIVDDRTFISLAAQVQRYKLAGLAMQVARNQFTYEDYDEIYLDSDLLEIGEDKVEIEEKLNLLNQKIAAKQLEILKRQGKITESSEQSSTIPLEKEGAAADQKAASDRLNGGIVG